MMASMMGASTRRKAWFRRGALAAVILVPLAFAGLVVGAISGSNSARDRIPAALVNQDKLIYQTQIDGSETPVFAGRQLVTELIADDSFDWTITNEDAADRALAAGEVYAILTIPSDFSGSILSLSSDQPRQAAIDIRTDDSHSYLTGALSESVGTGMAKTFGQAITEQYIAGIYSGIGELGGSLGKAADGAGELSSGASGLSDGLIELSNGAASARGGADSLASGVAGYTSGVDSLSAGLNQLNAGAAGLSGITSGVNGYAGAVSGVAADLASASAALAADPGNAGLADQVAGLSQQLAGTANGGASTLNNQVSAAVSGVQGGIAQSASGAAKLAAGSASLRSGARSMATGLGGLTAGAASAATGAGELASGATELATGLTAGAEQVPAIDAEAQASTAKVAADPVGITVTRDNQISDIGQALVAFLVPLGLWIGAMAVFLVLRPVAKRMLSSTAPTQRLLASTLGRASLITLAQAVLLVGLLHLGQGVSWTLLPVTLGFAAVTALAFTAFHQFLVTVFGRAGLVISLLAVAIQVTATGGLYPVQLLSAPFQLISPLLPLTYAVSGMQGIIAGGSAAPVIGSVVALLGFGVASVMLSLLALRRSRRVSALRLAAVS